MKILDAVVTKIMSKPYKVKIDNENFWQIAAEYDYCGISSIRLFTFISKEDAENIKVGYKFQN